MIIQEVVELLLQTVISIWKFPNRITEVQKQLYEIGHKSLFMILVCVSFAAGVTIIESAYHMKIVVQTDALVPGFAAMLIVRELSAVVMGLLLAARVGAGMSAEIGSMKITEQIDALKLLQINPIEFLVMPRFLSSMIAGFCLSIIANVVCLYCAMLVSTVELGFSSGSFFSAVRQYVEFKDLMLSALKGTIFGAVIPIVSSYFGFKCGAGAVGVGEATTNSVVVSSVLIILLDFMLSYVFTYFY